MNRKNRKFYEQGFDDGYDKAEYAEPDGDDEGAYMEGYEDGQVALESDMIGDEW